MFGEISGIPVGKVRTSADAVPAPSRNRGLAAAGLALLLLLGVFYIFGAASDLVSLVGHNLPADHQGTFTSADRHPVPAPPALCLIDHDVLHGSRSAR